MTRPALGEVRSFYSVDYDNLEDGPTGGHEFWFGLDAKGYFWKCNVPNGKRLKSNEAGHLFEDADFHDIFVTEREAYDRCITILRSRARGQMEAADWLESQRDAEDDEEAK